MTVYTHPNLKPLSEAKDPDLRHAMAAMLRAAQAARKIAIQTNTALIVVRNGQRLALTGQALLQDEP